MTRARTPDGSRTRPYHFDTWSDALAFCGEAGRPVVCTVGGKTERCYPPGHAPKPPKPADSAKAPECPHGCGVMVKWSTYRLVGGEIRQRWICPTRQHTWTDPGHPRSRRAKPSGLDCPDCPDGGDVVVLDRLGSGTVRHRCRVCGRRKATGWLSRKGE